MKYSFAALRGFMRELLARLGVKKFQTPKVYAPKPHEATYHAQHSPFPRAIQAGGKYPPPGWKDLSKEKNQKAL